MLLKPSKVVKELKRSSMIDWARKDNIDYICNGYWGIKIDLKDVNNRKILGFLIEIFGEFPPESKIMRRMKHYKNEQTILSITKDSWLNLMKIEDKQIIEDTSLTIELPHSKDFIRIFKGENYIYLNTQYLEMIDLEKSKFYGNKQLLPVAFVNNNEMALVFPMRMNDSYSGMEYLKSIDDYISKEEI